jgi:hypothetical protein
VSRSKDIGTRGETAVVKVAKLHGFPFAARRTLKGSADEGDVQLDSRGRVIVEVKAGKAAESASDNQIAKWLDETERERVNAGAERAFLVVKRAGKGDRNAGLWWAVSGLDSLANFDIALYGRGQACATVGPVVRLTLADMLEIIAEPYGEEAA